MGSVIKPDKGGTTTAALTETGTGGLLSNGYLRDDPAGEYVGDGETPAYVVTNASEGVVRTRGEQETVIRPGDGYRTIAVVTDRRLIVLVGDADDGDERITLPLVEVAGARVSDGDLVVELGDGERWRIHAGDGRIEDVAAYVEDTAGAWEDVESSLDAVKRRLVEATARRDEGEYGAGIDAAQAAYDELGDAVAVVDAHDEQWPAAALHDRVDGVRTRCVSALADVRVGNGRAIADRAEERWREGEYEAAHDAYDRARAEFEAVAALDADRHDQADAVEAGLDRIDRAIEELREAPLQRAIEIDRRAREAEDRQAIDDWRLAIERYRETLALDVDEPERRFAGDPEKIRARVATVVELVLETAREDGVEALGAGRWFQEAGKAEIAREEVELARDLFERALAVARDAEPAAVEELDTQLAEAETALARIDGSVGDGEGEEADDADVPDDVDEDREGERDRTTGPGPPGSRQPGPAAHDGDGGRDAALRIPGSEGDAHVTAERRQAPADGVARPGQERVPEPVASDGAGAAIDVPAAESEFENHLRALDPEGFGRLVRSLLEAEGLEPAAAGDDEPHDFRVERSDGRGDLLVRTIHRPLAGPIDADEIQATSTAAAMRDDDGMLVTSSSLTEAGTDEAVASGVRVIEREDIEHVLDGQSSGPFGRGPIATED